MKEFECDPTLSPTEIIDSLVFSEADFLEKQKTLREIFDTYRQDRRRLPEDPDIKLAQWLIERDSELCKSADPVTKRQHNTFALFYAAKKTYKTIAITQGITTRTVARDLSDTLDRMMILLFGVDGVCDSLG